MSQQRRARSGPATRLVVLAGLAAALVSGLWWWTRSDAPPAHSVHPSAGTGAGTDAAKPAFADALAAGADAKRPVESLSAAPLPPTDGARAPVNNVSPPVDPHAVLLRGRVLDAEGHPVPGAWVSFSAGTQAAWALHWAIIFRGLDSVPDAMRTDGSGRFELHASAPPPSDPQDAELQPRLIVLQEEHAVCLRRCDGLRPGTHDVGDIVLAPGATLFGRVFVERLPQAAGNVWAAETSASASGAFPWKLAPLQDVDVVATDVANAFGTARDAQADERVREFFLAARTDSDGRFRITGLLEGKAGVEFKAPSLCDSRLADLELRSAHPLDLGDIVLAAGASIAGSVVDPGGQPVERASVQVNAEADTEAAARRTDSGADATPAGNGAVAGSDACRSTRGIAYTNAQGNFEISGLMPGRYAAHVAAQGFAYAHVHDIATGTADLRVAVRRFGALRVIVHDEVTGAPIDGAEVKATLPPECKFQPWSDRQFKVRAGAEVTPASGESLGGVYLVDGAGPEGAELAISAPDYVSQVVRAPPVGPGETVEIEVRLQPGLAVSGLVIDETGAAVPDAHVTLRPEVSASAAAAAAANPGGADADGVSTVGRVAATTRTAVTDEAGLFRIGGAQPGECRISASAAGHETSTPQTLQLARGVATPPVELLLARHGTLAGRVLDANGAPASAVRVAMAHVAGNAAAGSGVMTATASTKARRDSAAMRDVITDADGRFLLTDLGAGVYDAWISRGELDRMFALAWADAEASQEQRALALVRRCEVKPAQTTEIVLQVPRAATLRGRVLLNGVPAGNSIVALTLAHLDSESDESAPRVAATTSGPSGEFELNDLPAGDFAVFAQPPGTIMPCVEGVRIEPGQALNVDLNARGARVEGRIIDAQSRAPIPGIDVQLGPYLDPLSHLGTQLFANRLGQVAQTLSAEMDLSVQTGSDGRFVLSPLPPGHYQIWVYGGNYLEGDRSFDLGPKFTIASLDIELTLGAAVEVTVEHAGLGPTPRLLVSVQDPEGQRVGSMNAEGGHYLIGALPAGASTLQVSAPDPTATPEPWRLLLTRPIVLQPGQTLQVTVSVDI